MNVDPVIRSELSKSQLQQDEIDLVEMLRDLWGGRYLIIGSVILCLFLAGTYLFLASPVYEARGLYTPPSQQQLIRLLPQPVQGFSLDRNSLFTRFSEQIRSNLTQERFFNDVIWPTLEQGNNPELRRIDEFDRFTEKLQIQVSDVKNAESYIRVSYQGSDPVQAAEWVKGYVDLASQVTLQYLREDFEMVRENAIENLERMIDGLKFASDQRKEQRIGQLKSALSIAQALGIEDNRVGQASVANVAGTGSPKSPSINLVEPPLYMYGTRELQAQIQDLVKSKGTYFDIDSLPDLESQLVQLRQARIQPKGVKAYTELDRPMLTRKPVSPKKMLILAVAIVIGGLIGAFGALIRAAVVRRNHRAMA